MSVSVVVSKRIGVGCIGRNRCGVYGCPIASRGVIVAVTVVLEWFVNPLVKSTVTLVTHSSTPPLFGRGLQPGSPLSAITVVCSSASSKVCVSAMLRNSLFLGKRSGESEDTPPDPRWDVQRDADRSRGLLCVWSHNLTLTMWGRHAGSFLAIVNHVSYSGKGVGLWSGACVVGWSIR
ncbi:hypothetical protein HMPREF9344_02496 [Cutibacterium acnes HL097PA1]|nr:hypothetical protein HMPREF9344_02496 [Cutibacterium acnes HL097PA1]